jgi:hypothetical protein
MGYSFAGDATLGAWRGEQRRCDPVRPAGVVLCSDRLPRDVALA